MADYPIACFYNSIKLSTDNVLSNYMLRSSSNVKSTHLLILSCYSPCNLWGGDCLDNLTVYFSIDVVDVYTKSCIY